jgi:hypothetical protein
MTFGTGTACRPLIKSEFGLPFLGARAYIKEVYTGKIVLYKSYRKWPYIDFVSDRCKSYRKFIYRNFIDSIKDL